MALWEYKVITSGKGGFASPQLLENFLNQLGKEEWEVVEYRPAPDNFLAFTGLARRQTQRDWTLEVAAAAAAKAEEEQRRADERAASAARERESAAAETVAAPEPDQGMRDESFRRPRDTEMDQDPEALADEATREVGDWDEWTEEDELPTLFEAVRPHLRRNQKGPGQAVAVDYLAKRWEQTAEDITGALIECGFTVPESEDSPPDYFEFEGDLYWLNRNNRGQLFLNVREKPRPAFRVTPVRKLDPGDPATAELAAEHQAEADRKAEQRRQQEARKAGKGAKAGAAKAGKGSREAPAAAGGPLPEGEALLEALQPHMRQNRRGGGFSGSTAYLAKALKHPETDLIAALAAIGLKPSESSAKPTPVEIGANVYWLNHDARGGLWINGRAKREGEVALHPGPPDGGTGEAAAAEAAMESALAEAARAAPVGEEAPPPAGEGRKQAQTETPAPSGRKRGGEALAALRPLLEPHKRGSGASAAVEALANSAGRPLIDVLEALVAAGLAVPDSADDKPVTAEFGDETFWLSRQEDDSLWLHAKPKARRRSGGGRTRKKAAAEPEEGAAPPDSVEQADPRPAAGYTPEEATETSERP